MTFEKYLKFILVPILALNILGVVITLLTNFEILIIILSVPLAGVVIGLVFIGIKNETE